jgi:hypothetical protein
VSLFPPSLFDMMMDLFCDAPPTTFRRTTVFGQQQQIQAFSDLTFASLVWIGSVSRHTSHTHQAFNSTPCSYDGAFKISLLIVTGSAHDTLPQVTARTKH